MICSKCNKELTEGAIFCPYCQFPVQTTGLTEESPSPPKADDATVRIIPQPQEPEPKVAPEDLVTRDLTRSDAWRPSKSKVGDNALNHYELLGLDREANDEIVQVRIAALDKALEQWSRDPDARLQELGGKGKTRLRGLKEDLKDRGSYNQQLDRQMRQKKIEGLTESAWGFVEATKILTVEMWESLRYLANVNGLDRDELEEVIGKLKARGVQTGLVIGGREARSLEELKALCEGQGEKLKEVFGNGDLERWLQTAAKESVLAARAGELRNRHNALLGAQLWLWEAGAKILVLIESDEKWVVARIEEWIGVLYHSEPEKALRAFAASMSVLNSRVFEHWLRVIGHEDLSKVAKAESFNEEKGLWRVIWKAEEKCYPASFDQRGNESAYHQTKSLVRKYDGFLEGHFYHAANCALTERQSEMREHLSRAIAGNPEFAHRAQAIRYFENHRHIVAEIAKTRNIAFDPPPPSPPEEEQRSPKSGKKLPLPVILIVAAFFTVIGGLLYRSCPEPAPRSANYVRVGQTDKAHDGGIGSLAIASDGSMLISGGLRKGVNLWTVNQSPSPSAEPALKLRQSLKIDNEAACAVALSPDDRYLATSSGDFQVIGLWETSGGWLKFYPGEVNGADLVEWVDGQAQKPVKTKVRDALPKKFRVFSNLKSVAVSPSGNYLTGVGRRNQVKLWYTGNENDTNLLPENEVLPPAAFSPDSKMIATGGKDEKGALVILWELSKGATPKPAAKLRVQGESAYALSFSPDGKWLASGCGGHSFCLWDVSEAKSQYSSDQQIHEKYDGKEYIKSATEPIRLAAILFSPAKGGLLATVGEEMRSVKLWIWRGNKLELKKELTDEHNGVVTAIAFSKDARLLAIGCSNGRVTLYVQREE